MRFAVLFTLLFAWPAMAVDLPHTFTNGTLADADQVNLNFQAVAEAITSVYADPTTPGTTTGGIQEAVDSCGTGVSGNDPSNGCTVQTACGDVTVSSQIVVGGNTTATAKAGVRIVGCGSGSVNSAAVTNPSIGATTIVSSVAGYTIKFQACSNCSLEHLGFNGTDTSTGVLDIAESAASWPSSHIGVIDVDAERFTGYAFRTNAVSQVDQILFQRVSIRDSGGCLQQNYSQNVLTMFLQSECGRMKSTGDKIGFDIVAGSFQFINSFFGTSSTVTGQTGFRYGTLASVTAIRDSHLELVTTGNTLIDDNTGAGSGHAFGSNTFASNQVTVVGASNVCFDVATRGSWTVLSNHFQQTVACTSTFNMSNASDIASGDRLLFHQAANVNNIGGANTTDWSPTLGTNVVEE